MSNTSIFPSVRYRDADAAIEWLKEAFGFEEKTVHRGDDGVVRHAELRFGTGIMMLGQYPEAEAEKDPAAGAISLYVTVADPDAHYDRAKAAGAEIIRGVADQDHGSRDYGARDLEGNSWWFGTYDPYAPPA